ncbi:MAG TPA: HAD-IA family hydrolase [Solirubrobacteraceae bacterium]|nr:HAD-IA family hydrolase [Solirubrobacteraceae bacterium]
MTTQRGFRGAIFDVDGVLVDSPHEAAWRDAFQELMEGAWADIRDQTSWTPDAFTSRVYQEVLSGKPRMAGAMGALEHFGVPDPDSRVEAYADRKQEMVVELIEAGRFSAYPDALRFVIAVKDAGMRIAAASSSKNAGLFLRKIRLDSFAEEEGLSPDWMTDGLTLLDAFDVDISGREFAKGKPHPEIFLTAAGELGIEPSGAFVIEDAESGIQAAKAGEFAGLGVARHDDEALLERAHADIVVTSLDAISLEALSEGRLERRAG